MKTRNFLLLPGFGCDGDSMLELQAALESSPRDYKVHVMDFAGDTSLEAMVEHVTRQGGAEPMTLVGFSMGGWIAQAVAARRDSSVESLVLVSSWTHAPKSYLDIVRDLHQKVAGGMPLADLRPAVVSGVTDADRAEALADRWVAMAERVGVDTFLAETSAILAHPHVDAEARQITVPTLAVGGAQDGLIDPASQAQGAQLISKARFVTIQSSGHHLIWEQPTATNDVVLGWLDAQLA